MAGGGKERNGRGLNRMDRRTPPPCGKKREGGIGALEVSGEKEE